ncbi:MAG: hypothetical protein ABSD74_14750 [Rhizomicrobium sp.]
MIIPKLGRANTIVMAAAIAAVLASPAMATGGQYVAFDPTGSNYTVPMAINDASTITGYWFDGIDYHGFVRSSGGDITSFDPPGSLITTPVFVNDRGIIVGLYQTVVNNNSLAHGFLRDAKGTITSYDAPGSGGYTSIRSINSANAFTGTYSDNSGRDHGYVQDAKGNFATFDPPNSLETYPWSINNDGSITGYYYYEANNNCGSAIVAGFVRSPGGSISTFGYQQGVYPTFINAKNVTGGGYSDASCQSHGFVRNAKGTIEGFDFPGIPSGTYPLAINKQGTIVGWYLDLQDNNHGFLRAANGKIHLIQPDGAADSEAVGINASGQIAGYYVDTPSQGLHGFLYTK